jgi:hypothetical protein
METTVEHYCFENGNTAILFSAGDVGHLDAFATVEDEEEIELAHIQVIEGSQGNGFGVMLVKSLITYCQQNKFSRVNMTVIEPRMFGVLERAVGKDAITFLDEVNGQSMEIPLSIAQARDSLEVAISRVELLPESDIDRYRFAGIETVVCVPADSDTIR